MVFKRFRSHIILNYTPVMRSRIWPSLIFATLCAIFRWGELSIYVGGCIAEKGMFPLKPNRDMTKLKCQQKLNEEYV